MTRVVHLVGAVPLSFFHSPHLKPGVKPVIFAIALEVCKRFRGGDGWHLQHLSIFERHNVPDSRLAVLAFRVRHDHAEGCTFLVGGFAFGSFGRGLAFLLGASCLFVGIRFVLVIDCVFAFRSLGCSLSPSVGSLSVRFLGDSSFRDLVAFDKQLEFQQGVWQHVQESKFSFHGHHCFLSLSKVHTQEVPFQAFDPARDFASFPFFRVVFVRRVYFDQASDQFSTQHVRDLLVLLFRAGLAVLVLGVFHHLRAGPRSLPRPRPARRGRGIRTRRVGAVHHDHHRRIRSAWRRVPLPRCTFRPFLGTIRSLPSTPSPGCPRPCIPVLPAFPWLHLACACSRPCWVLVSSPWCRPCSRCARASRAYPPLAPPSSLFLPGNHPPRRRVAPPMPPFVGEKDPPSLSLSEVGEVGSPGVRHHPPSRPRAGPPPPTIIRLGEQGEEGAPPFPHGIEPDPLPLSFPFS
eukprot:scaffold1554_cov332-Pavlova_lutheri.AAC.7